jgi:NADH:ubiquinone oxidoreductase subunit B-like Fe-S oxidoreductase
MTTAESQRTLAAGEISPLADYNIDLSDRGFVLTSVDAMIQWARAGSLMWNEFGLACCALDAISVAGFRQECSQMMLALLQLCIL